ncbi:MAG: hypothetical protein JW936_06380 [Sedimentisphaerales bacterium]|nr:hypothetical protein [Sedimentisphaerales bacterium]
MQHKRTIIHVTQNPIAQSGGIADLLSGLLTSDNYKKHTERSLIIGPLHQNQQSDRLGPNSQVLYSSLDNIIDEPYCRAFQELESKFGVDIVYGRRTIINPITGQQAQPEVILVNTHNINPNPVNAFKAWLYEDFGIESQRYENNPEYDLCVQIAPAAVSILRSLSVSSPQHPALLVAHDYAAMPTILAGIMDPLGSFKTVFYCHQIAPVKRIVENHPGHDTMLLNTQNWAIQNKYYFDEVFGPHQVCFKHTLISAAANCDSVIADSEHILRELQFLGPQFDLNHCGLAYCGLDAQQISVEQKLAAKAKLQQYANNLLGFTPDYVFTHVARMTPTKAFWRDLAVLHQLDKIFYKQQKRGVFFVLSTDGPQRSPQQVREMENQWNWPVEHRNQPGDLTSLEAQFNANVEYFNQCHGNIKVVFINQFGWNRQLCGERMPEDTQLSDLRQGTDVEFGQSTYEPFGITPLKPITYGAICVTSSACACNDFVMALTGAELCDNLLIGDYANVDRRLNTAKSLLAIDQQYRDSIEHRVSAEIAEKLSERLPSNDSQLEKLLQNGFQLAQKMTWSKVCENLLMPALEQAYHHRRNRRTA